MKICLCGSTRFKDDYHLMNLELSKIGQVVYSVAGFGHSGDELTDEDKETLDLVHLDKILNSEMVVVVGETAIGEPYIGDSTRREIKWASMHDIPVFFMHQLWDRETKTMRREILTGE